MNTILLNNHIETVYTGCSILLIWRHTNVRTVYDIIGCYMAHVVYSIFTTVNLFSDVMSRFSARFLQLLNWCSSARARASSIHHSSLLISRKKYSHTNDGTVHYSYSSRGKRNLNLNLNLVYSSLTIYLMLRAHTGTSYREIQAKGAKYRQQMAYRLS